MPAALNLNALKTGWDKEGVVKKNILVIDDDVNVQKYLVSLFSDNGYAVQVAGDVKQAFEKVKAQRPDLITLDIEMPGEWGPRFYQKLSKDKQLGHIPFIVISGLTGHKYAVQKAVASISKPFDPDRLLKIVKKVLA